MNVLTPQEALKKAIQLAGGKTALARHLGVSTQVVDNWDRRCTPVPPQYAPAIERFLRAEVTADQLRPDLTEIWSYLRGTAKRDPKEAA